MTDALLWTALSLAGLSAFLTAINLLVYRRLPRASAVEGLPVSLLIPARNEEQSIRAAVESALANQDVQLEVVVLDDGSTDRTAAIVSELASRDGRVRLVQGSGLPAGWCGKQYACYTLAGHARYPLLCFMDADVRLAPDALRRMTGWLQTQRADLVSGFPRQETETFLERLLIPLIHFVLLGYLPMPFMRMFRSPGFAAGCGQLMLVRADAYRSAGGHSAIRLTLHDGLNLPKRFRTVGLRTDLFDATDVATCRMYRTAGEVWNGLMKNATEGMAAPARLPVFTTLLLAGHVLPWLLLPLDWRLAGSAAAVGLMTRAVAAWRFRQSWLSVLLHPVGVLLLVALQWVALIRKMTGQPSEWKGRTYAAGASPTTP